MLFSLLLYMIDISMGNTFKRNKSIREMMATRNLAFAIMTKDGTRGKRFVFRNGKYSSDKLFTDYTMALVWKDATTAFKTLAFGGETGLQDAMNNWDLKLAGDPNFLNLFGLLLMVSLGKIKR